MENLKNKLMEFSEILFQEIEENESNPFRTHWRIIPEKYTRRENVKPGSGLTLEGAHLDAFNDVLKFLRSLEECAHLRNKELYKILWNFVFKIYFEAKQENNPRASTDQLDKKLEEAISEFEVEAFRRNFDWIVILSVKNMEITEPLVFDNGIEVFELNMTNRPSQQLSNLINEKLKTATYPKYILKDWNRYCKDNLFNSIIKFQVSANNSTTCMIKVDDFLNHFIPLLDILNSQTNRIARNQIYLDDEKEFFLFPLKNGFNPVPRYRRKPNFFRTLTMIQDNYDKEKAYVQHLINTIDFSYEIDLKLVRSLKWYGRTLNESRNDMIHLFCIISLDTLFLKTDDINKSPIKLSFRLMLFEIRYRGSFKYPTDVIEDYDVRSALVHGAMIMDEYRSIHKKELAEKDFYEERTEKLRYRTKDMLYCYLKKIRDLNQEGIDISTTEEFIDWLEIEDDTFFKTVNWLLNISQLPKESDLFKYVNGKYGKKLKEWLKTNSI